MGHYNQTTFMAWMKYVKRSFILMHLHKKKKFSDRKLTLVPFHAHTVREMYFISLNKNSFCAGMSIHVMKCTVCWYAQSLNELCISSIKGVIWITKFILPRNILNIFYFGIQHVTKCKTSMYFVIQATHFVNEIHISFCETMHNYIFFKQMFSMK